MSILQPERGCFALHCLLLSFFSFLLILLGHCMWTVSPEIKIHHTCLRSADVDTCIVPRTRTRFGDRSFPASGPRISNSLSPELRRPDSELGEFRRSLKTFLFAYGQPRWRRSDCNCGAVYKLLLLLLLLQLLWNGAISNDLERTLTLLSRSHHHSLTLNISQTATDTTIITM